MNIEYAIKDVSTGKSRIKQPKLVEAGVLPPLGSSIIIVGRSGSGKTVLLHSLLNDKRFYSGFFDIMILISPTANSDDVQKKLGVDPGFIITDLVKAVQVLTDLQESQEKEIKENGIEKSPRVAVIFDDVVANVKFMNSPAFTAQFIRSRHFNTTVFLLSQHWKRVPRICRLQASFLVFFGMSESDAAMLAEEFSPKGITKQKFQLLIEEPHSFLSISTKSPDKERFREGLAMAIDTDDYK